MPFVNIPPHGLSEPEKGEPGGTFRRLREGARWIRLTREIGVSADPMVGNFLYDPDFIDTGAARSYNATMDDAEPIPSEETSLKEAMGRAITRARIAAGFDTQAGFSRAVEVRYQYMSRVEKGLENLTLQTLAKMTSVMRVPMPEFLAMVAQEMCEPTVLPPTRRGRPVAK